MIKKILAAALIASVCGSASAMELKVSSYTSNSITFSLTGEMPTSSALESSFTSQINLVYTGNLWAGGETFAANQLSANPFAGSNQFFHGNTGGFDAAAADYSWLLFANSLAGAQGTGASVTLNFASPISMLNTTGTGAVSLYWGNSSNPAIESGQRMLLSSVQILNGRVVDEETGDVPEPATISLLAICALGLVASRRRKHLRT